MCGIFAAFSGNHELNDGLLRKALDLLSHRGPDAENYWLARDAKVGMAQTRLKVIDLSEVKYPITDSLNQIRVVANCEFYDYKEIRNNLQKIGYHFKTMTDTEILVHLYQEHGYQFVNYLRGEFAFVLWDDRTRTMIAARDRFGIKPLYYTIHNNNYYFVSELPAMVKLGLTTRQWDIDTLCLHASLAITAENTLIRNVYQLPPGSIMVVRDGYHKIIPYWDCSYNNRDQLASTLNEHEIIDNTIAYLKDSIATRLVADQPTACYLSGGIDSSAILGIANSLSDQQLDAFTIGFDNEKLNEYPVAEETALFNKSKLYELKVTEQHVANSFIDYIQHVAFPVPNTAGVCRYLLSKYVRDIGYKVVFSGEGADEMFLGYNFMLWDALKSQYNEFSATDLSDQSLLKHFSVKRDDPGFNDFISPVQKTLGFVPKWLETQYHLNKPYRNLYIRDIVLASESNQMAQIFMNNMPISDYSKKYNVDNSCYIWFKTFFANTMLNCIGDRSEMAHGIEARLPYLDHNIFEFIRAIRPDIKLKNGVEKYILKEACKPYITDTVYRRKKHMFQAPMPKEQGCFMDLINEIIHSNLSKSHIYDQKSVYKFLNSKQDAAKNMAYAFNFSLTTLASMLIIEDYFGLTI